MPKNLTLGQFIAQRRKSLGWTQEQLADKVNVSKSAIAKWETDGGIPDRDNLYRLSNAIKISMTDLHMIIRHSGKMQIMGLTSPRMSSRSWNLTDIR